MEASTMAGAAKWASLSNTHKSSYYKGVSENDDMVMDHFLFQKSGIIGTDFMQNCDLPPPLKVFSGPDKTVVASMNRVCGIIGREWRDDDEDDDYEFDVCRSDDEPEREKLELLKALRLSQTRAREAEKRAASLAKERDRISKAFFEDSLRLLAYRQWMRLLDVQVSKLQSQQFRKKQEQDDLGDDDGIEVSWFVALAFCLGILGGGLALGCTYFL